MCQWRNDVRNRAQNAGNEEATKEKTMLLTPGDRSKNKQIFRDLATTWVVATSAALSKS